MTNVQTQPEVQTLQFGNYKIELFTNAKGQPVARYFKLLTSGKNKGQYKQLECFYFHTEQEREAYIARKKEAIKYAQDLKAAEKNAKAQAREDFKHGFTVGQILYSSWGYDQTNIDFYQITAIKGKMVTLQRIGRKRVEGSQDHWDSCRVIPNTESKGETEQRRISVKVYRDSVTYYIKSDDRNLYNYDAGEKGLHMSWGH